MDRYEEAMERMVQWEKDHPNGYVIEDMKKFVFPDLKESEDERVRKWLILQLQTNYKGMEMANQAIAYLEKQKEQKLAEWGDEDEKMAYFIDQFLEYHEASDPTAKSCKDWFNNRFKSIRPQPKQEWSEEDIITIDHAIDWLSQVVDSYIATKEAKKDIKRVIEELKSLRPSWKPSEEQMKALGIAIRCGIQLGTWEEDALRSLNDELKSL